RPPAAPAPVGRTGLGGLCARRTGQRVLPTSATNRAARSRRPAMRRSVISSRISASLPASVNVGVRRTLREQTNSVQISVPIVLPLRPLAPARRATYRETSSVTTTSSHQAHTPLERARPVLASEDRSSTPVGVPSSSSTTYEDSGALRSCQPR